MKTRRFDIHIRRVENDTWSVQVWLYRGRFHFRKLLTISNASTEESARKWGEDAARDYAYSFNFQASEYTYSLEVAPEDARPWGGTPKPPPPRPPNPLPPSYD